MKFRLLSTMLLGAVLLAGCGGSSGGGSAKLESSDIAVVGSDHVTQSAYNQALAEEQASLKQAGQAFPKAGSTQYQAMQTSIINALVQDAEFKLEATKLGLVVTPAEVQAQLVKLKKKYFAGSQAKYEAGLKQEGFTNAEVVASINEQLLQQKIFDAVTKGVTSTPTEIAAYYAQNIGQYSKPATRKVREILAGKNKQKLAELIYSELKSGSKSFAALAKKYSQDPGSKDSGGLFTATEGSDVPEFDAAVFASSAKTGVLLKPVKTAQYGWFVIQPLAPIVAATTTSEAKAAPAIRKTLNTTKDQAALSAWVTKVSKSYCSGGQIKYQVGYSPSPDPCASITAPNPTTT
jgi:parvulin-like peptidyl-prolyl isomerase